jgi:hypothetical protein
VKERTKRTGDSRRRIYFGLKFWPNQRGKNGSYNPLLLPPVYKALDFCLNADKSDDVASHTGSAIRPSSLCFYDAAVARKENTISEDEYLQAFVAHCTGIRNGINQLCNGDTKVIPVSANPYPDSVHEWKRFFASNVATVDVFASTVSQFIANYVGDESKQVIGMHIHRCNSSISSVR